MNGPLARGLLCRCLLGLASAGLVGGLACARPEAAPGASVRPIVGGTRDTGDPAVVLVVIRKTGTEYDCSGFVVSPHVVVTAAHCLSPYVIDPGFLTPQQDAAVPQDAAPPTDGASPDAATADGGTEGPDGGRDGESDAGDGEVGGGCTAASGGARAPVLALAALGLAGAAAGWAGRRRSRRRREQDGARPLV